MGKLKTFMILALGVLLVVPFTNCSRAKFDDSNSNKGSSGVVAIGDDQNNIVQEIIDVIDDGDEIDPDDLDQCEIVDPDFPTACLIFKDSFERDEIVEHQDFRWDTVLMDKRSNTSNVDAKIEHSSHLGPVEYGNKALLVRGRDGGSTHEVYLVSAPFDISSYDQIIVQYKYLPIQLEEFITLSWNKWKVAEGPRIDVCYDSDYNCGLEGDDRYKRLRNPDNWEHHYPEFHAGRDNQIRDYTLDDWKLHQVVINVSDIPAERREKFVFKLSVAVDEGYICNDRKKKMEDGVIVDQVILAAIRTNTQLAAD